MAGVEVWVFSCKGVVLKHVFMARKLTAFLSKHEMLTCSCFNSITIMI